MRSDNFPGWAKSWAIRNKDYWEVVEPENCQNSKFVYPILKSAAFRCQTMYHLEYFFREIVYKSAVSVKKSFITIFSSICLGKVSNDY